MLNFVAKVNQQQQKLTGDPEIQTSITQQEMAFRMQMSVPELTDLSGESKAALEMYGPEVQKTGSFARNCLLARRMAERNVRFILGARLRSVKEIREQVLSRGGRYHEIHPPRQRSKDPSPLKVKEVYVGDHRYIVCHNEEQAAKDRHDRKAILAKLEQQLKRGSKSLVGNKGYRKYLRQAKQDVFVIDRQKVKSESRFDGKWVLRTDTDLPSADVALKYKDLLLVESIFRSMKSILETRPIFHK